MSKLTCKIVTCCLCQHVGPISPLRLVKKLDNGDKIYAHTHCLEAKGAKKGIHL